MAGSRRPNSGLWVLNAAILGAVCAGCACTVWASAGGVGLPNQVHVSAWVAIPISVLEMDLVSYPWHRANHAVPFLWRFHGDKAYTSLLLIAHGVTTVRVPGGSSPARIERLRARIDAGALPGPRILSCGAFMDGPDPVLPGARVVADAEQAQRAVRELGAGAPADLVVLRADPTRDLAALRGILAVVRDGRVYSRADLDTRLERYSTHYARARFRAFVLAPLRAGLRALSGWLRGRGH